MLLATVSAHNHHAHLNGPLETLIWVVAVIATILAVLGLLASLVHTTERTGWRGSPVFINWWAAAVVAIIAWVVLWVF